MNCSASLELQESEYLLLHVLEVTNELSGWFSNCKILKIFLIMSSLYIIGGGGGGVGVGVVGNIGVHVTNVIFYLTLDRSVIGPTLSCRADNGLM